MDVNKQLSQMKLRLPVALKQWVREMAERNRRSENGEIVFRLEQCKEQEEKREVAA